MGAYATKAFFEDKLKDLIAKDIAFFEVAPAPDCCPECEAKANKKIKVKTATKDDILPFHKECVEFKPPFIAKVLNAVGRFWLRNWQYIVSTIVTLFLGLLTLYIAYLKLIKTP